MKLFGEKQQNKDVTWLDFQNSYFIQFFSNLFYINPFLWKQRHFKNLDTF